MSTQLIEFGLISNDKCSRIDWTGHLPGGRLTGSNDESRLLELLPHSS
jgi:hypothetical protein